MPVPRRWVTLSVFIFIGVVFFFLRPPSQVRTLPSFSRTSGATSSGPLKPDPGRTTYRPAAPANSVWRALKQRHPAPEPHVTLPSGALAARPRVQTTFKAESAAARATRTARLEAVREAFKHTWEGYRRYAWTHDELMPVSATAHDPFGGWMGTLVDSLDTLWIMGLQAEWDEAVAAVRKLDFSSCSVGLINVFETTIRLLGGLLSAYDLSGERLLLDKALELGEMLYVSFDTPNRLPNTRWNWEGSLKGEALEAGNAVVSAEVGSLSLEFTRLSQLSGESKYYDAIARITDLFASQQRRSNAPGLWPVFINPRETDVSSGSTFGIGGMADSLYEYLPKTWALLGGRVPQYRSMYESALSAMRAHLFYRPLNPWKPGKLWASGDASVNDAGDATFSPRTQHLSCFAGGMVALAARYFNAPAMEMELARSLTDTCIWAYNAMPSGIAPEIFSPVPCNTSISEDPCAWDAGRWHTAIGNLAGYRPAEAQQSGARLAEAQRYPPGFQGLEDRRYQLRPEAIESVFILYRITGDPSLREHGWDMVNAVLSRTKAPYGFAGLIDVTEESKGSEGPALRDRMESFWPAETLKYAYLLFADEGLISLDEWVFSTEAHPLRLPW